MSRNNVKERFNAVPELQAPTGAAVANDCSRIVISDSDDMVTFNVEGARKFASWLRKALPLPPGSVDLRLIETEGRDEGLYEDIVYGLNLSRAAGAKPSQVMVALQDAFLNAAAAHHMTFQEVLYALRKVMSEYAASLPFTTEFVELEAAQEPAATASRTVSDADELARDLAAEIVQSLSDSEPTGRSMEGMDKLRGTPLESMFVLDGDDIRSVAERIISNAIFDKRLIPAPVTLTR